MSRVIRISDETFSRLQKFAEPLVDTPANVIEGLLEEHESTLKKKESEDSNQNFFLTPASKSNIKRSIKRKIEFKDVEKYLNNSNKDKLQSIINREDAFNCWAMTEANRSTFNKMDKEDFVLLSENSTGKFNYGGIIKGKIESKSLGDQLWGFEPRKPWSLIYIIKSISSYNISKKEMVQALGYSENDRVQRVRIVKKQNLNQALKHYGDIKSMINSLNRT